MTLEPMLFVKMLAESNLVVVADTLEIDRICRINLNYTEEQCTSMDDGHHEDVQIAVQKAQNTFNYYQGLMDSILPLLVVAFVGSYSDRHGRKAPMLAVLTGFMAFTAVYLLMTFIPTWPVQVLFAATFFVDITGSWVVFNMAVYSYMADITTPHTRTRRIAILDACWYMGAPLGRLLGAWIYQVSGYTSVFLVSGILYLLCFAYLLLLVPESVKKDMVVQESHSDSGRLKRNTQESEIEDIGLCESVRDEAKTVPTTKEENKPTNKITREKTTTSQGTMDENTETPEILREDIQTRTSQETQEILREDIQTRRSQETMNENTETPEILQTRRKQETMNEITETPEILREDIQTRRSLETMNENTETPETLNEIQETDTQTTEILRRDRSSKRCLGPFYNLVELCRTAFMAREGRGRLHLLLLVGVKLLVFLCQGHQLYLWARRVLTWGPTKFSIWTSVDSVVHQVGMVGWVWMAERMGLSGAIVAIVGLASLSLWSSVLACITGPSLWWLTILATLLGSLEASIEPALRTLLTIVAGAGQAGRVLAFTGLLEAAFLTVDRSLYTYLYNTFVESMPQINFLVQASWCLLLIVVLIAIKMDMHRTVRKSTTPTTTTTPTTPTTTQHLSLTEGNGDDEDTAHSHRL